METEPRRVVPAMHAVFTIGSVLVAAAGVQLYVLTDHTDRFFAWTIDSGLSAAFLGGFYLMALVVAQESAREDVWARARVGVYGVTLFVTLTLLATLVHLDTFHLDQGDTAARIAAWVWLAIYVAAPVGTVTAIVLQRRAPGGDPPRERLLPIWYRALLGVQAIAFLAVGLVLLVSPASATWWPWSLTPLVSRAMASWLLGLGVVLATAVWENDWGQIRVTTLGYAVLGVLQVLAVARYAGDVNGGAATAAYLVVLALAIFTGGYGALASRLRPSSR